MHKSACSCKPSTIKKPIHGFSDTFMDTTELNFFTGLPEGATAENVWTDGVSTYYSAGAEQYVLNGGAWEPKTWNGLTDFYGYNIWTINGHIHYSTSHTLNGDTWEKDPQLELIDFNAGGIWTDGTTTYYSAGNSQYIRNGDIWETIEWTGVTPESGEHIWNDNVGNTYYSKGDDQFVLNGSVWEPKTWNGFIPLSGMYIWSDGINIYHSAHLYQYVLNGNTWEEITRLKNVSMRPDFTDGTNFYHIEYGILSSLNYVLEGKIWKHKIWEGLSYVNPDGLWHDHNGNIYYSIQNRHYALNGNTWEPRTWSGLESFMGYEVWNIPTATYCSTGSNYYVLNGDTWEQKTFYVEDDEYYQYLFVTEFQYNII